MSPRAIIEQLKQYPLMTGGIAMSVLLIALIVLRDVTQPDFEAVLSELKEREANVEFNEEEGQGLEEDLADLREKMAYAGERLMDPDEPTPNKQYVLSLAEGQGVSMPDPRLGAAPPVGKNDAYSVLVYNVTVTGGFNELLAFMRAVREGEHLAKITELSMRPEAGEDVNFTRGEMRLEFLASKPKE